MNRGCLGAGALNVELQGALKPLGETQVAKFDWTF
jgi:hypothetical protein